MTMLSGGVNMILGWFRRSRTKREIVINAEMLQTRVAIVENSRLEEYQVEFTSKERIVGNIYKGRIQNLENDLQAAFVDIGLRKNAFLHYWDMIPEAAIFPDLEEADLPRPKARRKRYTNEEIAKRFPPGSDIVVQVTKGPIGTKGPRVTANLSIPGRYLVLLPGTSVKGVSRKIEDAEERGRVKRILDRLPLPEGTGLIVRTAAIGGSLRGFGRDLRGLANLWADVRNGVQNNPSPSCVYQEPDLVERVVRDWLTEDVDRITIDAPDKYERIRHVAGQISRSAKGRIHLYRGELPIFEHFHVERQLEEALQRKVNLKSGGYIVVDETEAMIAVDVNTGRHKGGGSQEQSILEVNTEAVEEVARQLRLRNIGGLVVIDLIDMKSKKHQNAVHKAMKAVLRRDRARTNVLPISQLGLMEMTRQRAEESLHSSVYADCPYCKGRGTVKSTLGISVEIQRHISSVLRRHEKGGEAHRKLQVVVHPNVLERLRNEDEDFLIRLEAESGCRLSFKTDPTKHIEYFVILDADSGKVLYVSKESHHNAVIER